MAHRVCPWWLGYWLACPLRRVARRCAKRIGLSPMFHPLPRVPAYERCTAGSVMQVTSWSSLCVGRSRVPHSLLSCDTFG